MNSPFNEQRYKELLEGLEISEVNFLSLSDVIDYRIEAEYFSHKYLDIDKCLSRIKNISFTKIAKAENGRPYSSEQFNNTEGVHISKIGDVTNKRDYLEWEYVTHSEFIEQKGKLLVDGDILMTLTGDPPDVGKVNYIRNPINSSWNQRVARIEILSNQHYYKSNKVFFSVLSSKYVRTQLERYAKGIRQRNLGNECFKKLLIPILSDKIQSIIENVVTDANDKISLSQAKYREAEDILLDELVLTGWQPSNNQTNEKSLKESFLSSGRLDSEYYQTKYESYEGKIMSYTEGFKYFEDVCSLNETIYTPLDGKFYKYIELANIGTFGEITGCTEDMGNELPSRARRTVHANDVIVSSIEGSLESCAIVPKEYDNSLCSTGFYIVKSDFFNPETLLVLFKSEPIRMLMKKGCSGTILTAISRKEIKKIPIPLVNKAIQASIAEKIQKSFKLRAESQRLLEEAKQMVEHEIESL